MSLTEIKEEQYKEGDTFLVQSGNLKLCSSESAQKIREKNYPEVLCLESGIEQVEDTDAIPKGGDSLPQPCSLQCFPDLKSHSTLHKILYLLESQVYLKLYKSGPIPWYTIIATAK